MGGDALAGIIYHAKTKNTTKTYPTCKLRDFTHACMLGGKKDRDFYGPKKKDRKRRK